MHILRGPLEPVFEYFCTLHGVTRMTACNFHRPIWELRGLFALGMLETYVQAQPVQKSPTSIHTILSQLVGTPYRPVRHVFNSGMNLVKLQCDISLALALARLSRSVPSHGVSPLVPNQAKTSCAR